MSASFSSGGLSSQSGSWGSMDPVGSFEASKATRSSAAPSYQNALLLLSLTAASMHGNLESKDLAAAEAGYSNAMRDLKGLVETYCLEPREIALSGNDFSTLLERFFDSGIFDKPELITKHYAEKEVCLVELMAQVEPEAQAFVELGVLLFSVYRRHAEGQRFIDAVLSAISDEKVQRALRGVIDRCNRSPGILLPRLGSERVLDALRPEMTPKTLKIKEAAPAVMKSVSFEEEVSDVDTHAHAVSEDVAVGMSQPCVSFETLNAGAQAILEFIRRNDVDGALEQQDLFFKQYSHYSFPDAEPETGVFECLELGRIFLRELEASRSLPEDHPDKATVIYQINTFLKEFKLVMNSQTERFALEKKTAFFEALDVLGSGLAELFVPESSDFVNAGMLGLLSPFLRRAVLDHLKFGGDRLMTFVDDSGATVRSEVVSQVKLREAQRLARSSDRGGSAVDGARVKRPVLKVDRGAAGASSSGSAGSFYAGTDAYLKAGEAPHVETTVLYLQHLIGFNGLVPSSVLDLRLKDANFLRSKMPGDVLSDRKRWTFSVDMHGEPLRTVFRKPDFEARLDREQAGQVLAMQILSGAWDGHWNQAVGVELETGYQIHFFDNERSMPGSNDLMCDPIHLKETLRFPFRTVLLGFPISREPVSLKVRHALLSDAMAPDRIARDLADKKLLITDPENRDRGVSVRSYVLDARFKIDAFQERLAYMRAALLAQPGLTYRGLFEAAFPLPAEMYYLMTDMGFDALDAADKLGFDSVGNLLMRCRTQLSIVSVSDRVEFERRLVVLEDKIQKKIGKAWDYRLSINS